MSAATEHYSSMCFHYARHAAGHKANAKDGKYGKRYAQIDWEFYLRHEDLVVKYAAKLMQELEHENAVLLTLFKNGDLK